MKIVKILKNAPPSKCCREDMTIGMLMNHVMHIHISRMRNNLESYGVQKTYGPILRELSESEGITQKELAGSMRITAPSMSVNLKKMENAGLLIKKGDNADMRQVKLYLTEKGRAVAEKTEREINYLDEELVKNLTDDEKKELKRMLIKILESLEDLSDKGGEV